MASVNNPNDSTPNNESSPNDEAPNSSKKSRDDQSVNPFAQLQINSSTGPTSSRHSDQLFSCVETYVIDLIYLVDDDGIL